MRVQGGVIHPFRPVVLPSFGAQGKTTAKSPQTAEEAKMAKLVADFDPPVPVMLKRLFALVPKTENHMHLSGSTPIPTIREFMAENGRTPAQIEEDLKLLKPSYKDLDDFLFNAYYKIPAHVKTKDQFRRATLAIVKRAVEENVRVIEVRSSVLGKGDAPEELVEAIEQGLQEGVAWAKTHKNYTPAVSLTILAQRHKGLAEAMAHAQIAVKMAQRPGSLVRGFDLAGSEGQFPFIDFKPAFDYIHQYGRPLGIETTCHGGETEHSGPYTGKDSIRHIVAAGVKRLGHGTQAKADPELKALLKAKKIGVEVSPWSNRQLEFYDYHDHPIGEFIRDGLMVAVATDNRMMHQIAHDREFNLTQQLGQLWAFGHIQTWDELKTLTRNGIEMAFLPEAEKQRVRAEADAIFDDLGKRFAGTIAKYLTPKAGQAKPTC